MTGAWMVEWGEELGPEDCPTVRRWMVQTPVGSVRLHHWLGVDDPRAHHDHPWWFATLVLRGGYADVTPRTREELRAPAARLRRAGHVHQVRPLPGPDCWTAVLTGPARREWGFFPVDRPGTYVRAVLWTLLHGRHPCEPPARGRDLEDWGPPEPAEHADEQVTRRPRFLP